MLDSELRITGDTLLSFPVFRRFHQKTAKGDMENWGARASHHDLHISLQPTPSPICVISGEENKFSKLFVKIYPIHSKLKLVSKLFLLQSLHTLQVEDHKSENENLFLCLTSSPYLIQLLFRVLQTSAGGEERKKDDKASPAFLNVHIMRIKTLVSSWLCSSLGLITLPNSSIPVLPIKWTSSCLYKNLNKHLVAVWSLLLYEHLHSFEVFNKSHFTIKEAGISIGKKGVQSNHIQ